MSEGAVTPVMPRLGMVLVALGIVILAWQATGSQEGIDPAVPTSQPAQATLSAAPRPSGLPCRPTLQAEIDAASGGDAIDLRGCTYDAGATIDKPLTVLGGMVRLPPGTAGITIEADDVTLDGIEIVGAQSGQYVFEEIGVLVQATPDRPVRRLTIRNSRLSSLGGFGAYLRNVESVRLAGNEVHDIVYAGLMILSGRGGTVEDNDVQRIGVQGAEANGGNAYGIAVTTGAGGEPVSSDIVVQGNTVIDVPTWHALDTHGGSNLVFQGNTVRGSMRAIFITTDTAGNEPSNIAILGNFLLSPAPVTSNLGAITLYRARDVSISENTATGWGRTSFVNDFQAESTDVYIGQNIVQP